MSRQHDYVGCELAACRLCDAFGDGWSQGKVKMRDEIVTVAAERRHAADCGCVPCAAVREVLRGKGWRPPKTRTGQGRLHDRAGR